MMAAISMPPVRSTLHSGASLPATVAPHSLPRTRIAKRQRDLSQDHDEPQTPKRQKVQDHAPSRPNIKLSTATANNAFKAPSTTVKDVVTQTEQSQKQNAVQPAVDHGSANDIAGAPITSHGKTVAKGPAKIIKQIEKRTLRSQDGGSRSKSELALYFANYDDIVSNEPREPEYLTAATRLYIIDEPASTVAPGPCEAGPIKNPSSSSKLSSSKELAYQSTTTIGSDSLPLNDAQRIEFPKTEYNANPAVKDPLSDEIYAKAHRRAERSEKQLRNIEKERAMHEKAQLERLLDGLKGHDWLKIMGVSGVTDGGKASWEPKRDYFIHEVEALLEKFREWKEEEKRRKAEREERMLADEMEESETPGQSKTPDFSDVDACAARQLHQETVTATSRRKRNRKITPHPLGSPAVEKPFTSFYSKPYLREAALGKHRRGRTKFAFGQPLPDMEDKDFELPEDFLTHGILAANARSRRRVRRESRV